MILKSFRFQDLKNGDFSMVCVSLAEKNTNNCLKAMRGLEFAEIRLDKMKVTDMDVETLFSQKLKLIATCRPGSYDEETRKRLLEKAIDAGAAYVDIEVEASDEFKDGILSKARAKGCKVIISYHNFERTPKKAELEHIVDWCFESGADIAKIACKVNSEQDNARLLGLLDSEKALVIVGMGKKGRITRIIAPLLGSAFTFASLSKGNETAEGQIDIARLRKKIKVLKDD